MHFLEDWKIGCSDKIITKYTDIDVVTWYSTDKPVDVHTCLIDNGLLEDPAYGTNDTRQNWIKDKTWVYKTSFLSQDMKSPSLVLEGVDTFCYVYLNGQFISKCDNMFLKYIFDVSALILPKNELVLIFPPLSSEVSKKELPEGFWINYSTERAFARKAGYNFGWDWTPRVQTVGLWKPVYLVDNSIPRIDNLKIDYRLNDNLSEAVVDIKINLSGKFSNLDNLFKVSIVAPSGERIPAEYGKSIVIEDPYLWNTFDIGVPYLYSIEVDYCWDGNDYHYSENFGIRKIELCTNGSGDEQRFLFKINNKDVFLRGANWVPGSNRPVTLTEDYYKRILSVARDANMNTLILWGGGIYEPKIFFDTCDKLGIVVWQYFMFACGEYPDYDADFLLNVHKEIKQVVKTLHNHPSLIMYVGNVENTMISQKIGLERKVYGDNLFYNLIPLWLKEEDDNHLYIPTSPIGKDKANSMTEGDRHNWDLWFSDLPYEEYSKDMTLFASEFGIHSLPVYESVQKYTGLDNPGLESYEFTYLNRDQDINRLKFYVNTHIGVPKDTEEYILMSQLVQAEALKYACNHYRSRFPYCGGSVIWQLNDCCGVQSWSMIDYDLKPKAAYYYARKFFNPVSVAIIKGKTVNDSDIFVCNNTSRQSDRRFRIRVMDFNGVTEHDETIAMSFPPSSVSLLKSITVGGRFYPNVIIGNRLRNYCLIVECLEDENCCDTRFFEEYRNLSFPPASIDVSCSEDSISLKSKTYVRFVSLGGFDNSVFLSDNYFDLIPGETKTVRVTGKAKGKVSFYVKTIKGARKYYEV